MSEVLVVIPTYNERATIGSIVARILAAVPDAHILIVDDGSPDGTGSIAAQLADHNLRVHVLHRAGKLGLASAYRDGFTWGLERGYGYLVEFDGDGSHQAEELPALLAAATHADVVLGSRWVAGGRVVDWPLKRQVLSRGGSWYARMMLGMPFRDITGGYRVFSARALAGLEYDSVDSDGYSFQIEMLFAAWRAGFTIVEVPITFVERQFGSSKMSSHIVLESLVLVTRWGIRRVLSGAGEPVALPLPASVTTAKH